MIACQSVGVCVCVRMRLPIGMFVYIMSMHTPRALECRNTCESHFSDRMKPLVGLFRAEADGIVITNIAYQVEIEFIYSNSDLTNFSRTMNVGIT